MAKLDGRLVVTTGGCGDVGRAMGNFFMPRRSPTEGFAREEFREMLRQHKRLDLVIANAGMVANEPFLEITGEHWKATLDVNLIGAFYAAQPAAPIMAKQKPGRS